MPRQGRGEKDVQINATIVARGATSSACPERQASV
jgi:hypothetical protein